MGACHRHIRHPGTEQLQFVHDAGQHSAGAPGTPGFSSVTATSATASWGAASDNVGILRYEYSINGGSSWTNVGAAQSASLTGLSSAVTYTVLVRAYDTSSNPGPNSSNSFATLDNIPPGAPGTPAFSSVAATSATASWGAATDNVGILRYEYSINGGSSWSNVGAAQSREPDRPVECRDVHGIGTCLRHIQQPGTEQFQLVHDPRQHSARCAGNADVQFHHRYQRHRELECGV